MNILMNLKYFHTSILLTIFISSCSVSDDQQNTNTDLNKTSQSKNVITLTADFSDKNNQIGKLFDFFDVAVRTDKGSVDSKPADFGQTPQVNTVRMLGGWASKDVDGDAYKWDGNKFVYDFDQVTKRIDGWLANGWDIFQIVLDNPPWAFQRGFTFVDQPDGRHYLRKDANGVYGNGLPPADPVAWHQFIQALTTHLINTYGKDSVLKWRFRVGSEIDTRPQHWAGTRQEFFDHYKNTVDAVRSALPNAKIGAHFRESSFKSDYVDYTGNTEDAYAPNFIAWAKAHEVPYDFVAISYYPHINKPHELDMQLVYEHDFAPIQQHPDWDPNASLEIHEFKLISKMLRAGFVSVSTSHGSSFFALLSKLMLENDIKEVFQWGTGRDGQYTAEAITQFALLPMVGNDLYSNAVIGKSSIAGNRVDGIFTKHTESSSFDILLFNFNGHNLGDQQPEKARVSAKIAQPIGTTFRYRIGSIDKNNNAEQLFIATFPKARIPIEDGGWWDQTIHTTASSNKALNEEGKQVFLRNKHRYDESNMIIWDDWQSAITIKGNDSNSQIVIDSEIPSFAVQKVEIRMEPQLTSQPIR